LNQQICSTSQGEGQGLGQIDIHFSAIISDITKIYFNIVDYFLMKDNDDVYTGEQYAFEWKSNQLLVYVVKSIEGCDGDLYEKGKNRYCA
jgi:hypothetical protein